MSWALSAATASTSGAIDVTPLAATLKFAEQLNKEARFFPDTTTPVAEQSPREREDEEYAHYQARTSQQQPPNRAQQNGSEQNTARSTASSTYALHSLPPSQQASARGPGHSKKLSASSFVMTSMTTNTGTGARPNADAFKALPTTTSSVEAQLLPLHAQEALKNEVSHLKRELSRQDAKLLEKEEELARIAATLHKTEQEKVNEHAKMRATMKELRKAVAEGDSRLEFWKADFQATKARELEQIQKDNAAIVEQLNSHLEAVSNTLRASSTAMVPSSSEKSITSAQALSATSSSSSLNVAFNGAGSGLTHEEHLKLTMEKFRQERIGWERSRKEELTGLKTEHKVAMEQKDAAMKKLKLQYTQQYAQWKKQFASFSSELDYLTEYVVKLTYLLAEIDRGTYPVGQKHGVTSFVIPSSKRAFLKLDASASSSVLLCEKLDSLGQAFSRAGIPWDPASVHRNQSFLTDTKQVEARRLKEERRLELEAGSEGEEDHSSTHLLPASGSHRLALPSGLNSEEKEEFIPPPTGTELIDAFHTELASHPTIQYIKQLEEERDKYKYQLHLETRKKLELHQTLTSQNRLVEGNELFKRSKLEQQSRRSSSGVPTSSQSSSMSQLLSNAQANAGSGLQLSSVYITPHASPEKLHHSSSAASSKAAAILLASGTVAHHPAAGRQGIQIGYAAMKEQPVSEENLGLTKGEGVGEMRQSEAAGVMVSPAKVLDHSQTSHTATGAYRNANLSPATNAVRPASAMVRGYSSPQQAYYGGSSRPLSAATTSYLGGGSTSQGGTSTWNSRPTSAFISGSPVRPGSAVMTHSSFAPAGSSPARPVRGVHSAMASHPSPSGPIVSPAAYAKPTPMHVAHGNANAQVMTQQTAAKAHQDARNHALGVHPPTQPHSQESSRTPGSSPTTERSTYPHRASSAGRKRIDQ
jgi:hypothetical protein